MDPVDEGRGANRKNERLNRDQRVAGQVSTDSNCQEHLSADDPRRDRGELKQARGLKEHIKTGRLKVACFWNIN